MLEQLKFCVADTDLCDATDHHATSHEGNEAGANEDYQQDFSS